MDNWNGLYQPGMTLVPDRVDHSTMIIASDCNTDVCVVVIFGAAIYVRGVEVCTAEDNPYNNYWERQIIPAADVDLEFTATALDIFSRLDLAPAMLRADGHLLDFVRISAGAARAREQN